MRHEVTCLREKGRRLRAGEKPLKHAGELTIRVEPSNLRDGLPRRMARLWALDKWSSGQNERDLLTPLYEPRIVSFVDGVLEIAGIELASSSGETHDMFEHHQIWRCRPLNGERTSK